MQGSIIHTRRDLARQLRRDQGSSIKEIAKQAGVAYSTASLWVRDIQLTKEQRAKLDAKIGKAGAVATKERWDDLKKPWEERAIALLDEKWWALLVALYWAEGNKRGATSIANSDACILKRFIVGARLLFPEIRITYRLSLPARMGSDVKFKKWWEEKLGKPSSWYKTSRPKTTGKTKNKDYKGTILATASDFRFRTMLLAGIRELQKEVPVP